MGKRVKKNLCKCGCGQLVHKDYARGHIHKVSKAMYTEEWKGKISKTSKENNQFRGKHHTEETKEKLRQAQLGNKWTESERAAHEIGYELRRAAKELLRTKCLCGCGELAECGKIYIAGHHHRNRSEETIERMRKAHIGQPSWNKGKTYLDDPRIPAGDTHCRGMKGKSHSNESKNKMSFSQAKRYGQDISSWKRTERSLYEQIRKHVMYVNWRKEVYTRDKFVCQECGYDRGGTLHAHHLKPFAEILSENNIKTLDDAIKTQELWDINNGVTLCKKCHKALHRKTNQPKENL